MLRTKKIVLLLLMVSPFIFSNAWAEDKMKEPPIVTINGNMRAYSNVAARIADKTKLESLEIDIDNPLMKKVTKFYKIAQDQAKSYGESLVNKTIQVDDGITVSFTQTNKMIWVNDNEIRIKFDNEKHVITALMVR
jgi:hypothetical protein